jgi:hypothetical protein
MFCYWSQIGNIGSIVKIVLIKDNLHQFAPFVTAGWRNRDKLTDKKKLHRFMGGDAAVKRSTQRWIAWERQSEISRAPLKSINDIGNTCRDSYHILKP